MEISLRLLFKNELSGPLKQATQQAEKDLRPLVDGAERMGTAMERATKKATDGFSAMGIGLGNTKKQVQEVADQVEKQATRMERAMQLVNKAISAGGQGVKLWGQAVAGYEAGKYVLGQPVGRAMDYDMMLAHSTNTAFAGQSIAERRSGQKFIDESVRAAVRFGGGTRDAALSAYGEMVGSGVYDAKLAAAVLPTIVGAATGNNGSAQQFSAIALAGRRNMGLADESRMFDMATMAGQRGGFEIADMSRWLPSQMAAARGAGLSGWSGFAELLALNQAAVTTAGTKDEAGNNVVNFLNKVTSRDTALDFKRQGIDLDGSMLRAMEGGRSGVEAFGGLVDRLIAKDPRYAALKAKALSETGEKQKATYDAMAQIVEGAGIGKVIQDRQALMGFLAYRNQPQYKAMVPDFMGARDVWKSNLSFVSEHQGFKSQQADARMQFAGTDAFGVYGEMLGKATDKLVAFADENPKATAAVAALALSATAASAALGAAGLAGILTGKVNPADLLKKPGAILDKAKTAAKAAPAALGAAGLGSGALLAGVAPLALAGDSRDGGTPAGELARRLKLLESDLAQARKGYRREDGWLFDSYEKVGNKAEQDALVKRLAEEIAKIKVSVQIDGREVARSVNETNTRDGRRQ